LPDSPLLLGSSRYQAAQSVRPGAEQLREECQRLPCRSPGHVVGPKALQSFGELVGGHADEQPVDIVRVLVHQPSRRRRSFAQFVQLGDQQCRRSCDVRQFGAIVARGQGTNLEPCVVDDGGFEAGRSAGRVLRVRRNAGATPAGAAGQGLGDHEVHRNAAGIEPGPRLLDFRVEVEAGNPHYIL